MLPQRERRRFTLEEYLSLEQGGAGKSEFCHGEIFAMGGGTLEHNRIVRNLIRHLANALDGKRCEVFPSDMRLFLERPQIVTYPDVMVVCGRPQLMKGRRDTVTDATVLCEVLSAAYVRTEKFRYYRSCPSFQDYLVVAQDSVLVEHHSRQGPDQWLCTEHSQPGGRISLPSIGVTLELAALYESVFDPA